MTSLTATIPNNLQITTALQQFNQLYISSLENPNDYLTHFTLLRHIYCYNLYYPDVVLRFGIPLIQAYNPLDNWKFVSVFSFLGTLYDAFMAPSPIRDCIYDVIEQVCFAAIHTHSYTIRNQCLEMLQQIFGPHSFHVRIILGAIHESAENYNKALEIYEGVINGTPKLGQETRTIGKSGEIPSNNCSNEMIMLAKKRVIHIFKMNFQSMVHSNSHIPQGLELRKQEFSTSYQIEQHYLKMLNDFTMMYSHDFSGWYELYQYHYHKGMYQKCVQIAQHFIFLENTNHMSYIYMANAMYLYASNTWSNIVRMIIQLNKLKLIETNGQNQNNINSEKLVEKLNLCVVSMYQHYINARYYYSTAFDLYNSTNSAAGLFNTCKKLVEFYTTPSSHQHFCAISHVQSIIIPNYLPHCLKLPQHESIFQQEWNDNFDLLLLSQQFMLSHASQQLDELSLVSRDQEKSAQVSEKTSKSVNLHTFNHYAPLLYYTSQKLRELQPLCLTTVSKTQQEGQKHPLQLIQLNHLKDEIPSLNSHKSAQDGCNNVNMNTSSDDSECDNCDSRMVFVTEMHKKKLTKENAKKAQNQQNNAKKIKLKNINCNLTW